MLLHASLFIAIADPMNFLPSISKIYLLNWPDKRFIISLCIPVTVSPPVDRDGRDEHGRVKELYKLWLENQARHIAVDWMMMLKLAPKKWDMHLFSLVWGIVTDCCENGNEPSGCLKKLLNEFVKTT
jgi:hypothetical protein